MEFRYRKPWILFSLHAVAQIQARANETHRLLTAEHGDDCLWWTGRRAIGARPMWLRCSLTVAASLSSAG